MTLLVGHIVHAVVAQEVESVGLEQRCKTKPEGRREEVEEAGGGAGSAHALTTDSSIVIQDIKTEVAHANS